jgi:hypothetical protein
VRIIRDEPESYASRIGIGSPDEGSRKSGASRVKPGRAPSIKKGSGRVKRVLLFFVLLVANLLVANVVYNLCVAEKGTPIWESVKSNVVYNLLHKPHKSSADAYGMVKVLGEDSDSESPPAESAPADAEGGGDEGS